MKGKRLVLSETTLRRHILEACQAATNNTRYGAMSQMEAVTRATRFAMCELRKIARSGSKERT